MAMSAEKVSQDGTPKKEERKKPTVAQIRRLESKEEWISEEELYTEGSSDEDDMALRMKRRERREERKKANAGRANSMEEQLRDSPRAELLKKRDVSKSLDEGEPNSSNITIVPADSDDVLQEQEEEDSCYMWRPTQGSFKLKHRSDSEEKPVMKNGDACPGAGPAPRQLEGSLKAAYDSMHKLDAMLKDSDRKLKEAQSETLRAQLSTRSQLRQLRDQVGKQNIPLARNWDAFVQLCPTGEAASAAILSVGAGPDRGGPDGDGRADQRARASVLPRIGGSVGGSGCSSDNDSDDADFARDASTLAITDEEKMKLADLLRDLDDADEGEGEGEDVSRDAEPSASSGPRGGSGFSSRSRCRSRYTSSYGLDAEARRCLAEIDRKLEELGLDRGSAGGVGVGFSLAPGTSTRRQRLEDIDRTLEALAAAAREEVQPVGEEEVRRLLELQEHPHSGQSGHLLPALPAVVTRQPAHAPARAHTPPERDGGLDGELDHRAAQLQLEELLAETRRELPQFKFRYNYGLQPQPQQQPQQQPAGPGGHTVAAESPSA